MSGKIKFGETYESLAKNIQPYLSNNKIPTFTHYPMWWDKTITIYNKYEDPTTQLVKWYKHIIPNCFIQTTDVMVSGNQVTYNTDSSVVRIPQNNFYKPYHEWVNIPSTEKNNYITIHQGDIIIMGNIDDIIDEYTPGLRSTDLVSKYKELGMCLTVDNYQDNTGIGRACPHYFVSGE